MLARRHVLDGREFVVLHDEARRETLELDPATWAVLSCADGTRDVEGIIAAAARTGARSTPSALSRLLIALAERDCLREGAPDHAPDVVTIRTRPEDVAALPIASLPNYRYHCDGSGGCCRAYGSVLLTPGDRDRARAALPDHEIAGLPAARWFTPDKGSAPTPLSVPVAVDGGCGFLATDGSCEIHRRIGLEGKPQGCAAFPRMACADGVEVRVSVIPECACVLRPVPDGVGEPLDEGWTRGADIPAITVVDVLPASVVLDGERTESRAWLRSQVAEVLGEVERARDPARVCWTRADAWSSPEPVDLEPYVASLRGRARDLLRRRTTYVGENDWVLRSLQWLVGTLHLLGDADLRSLIVAPTEQADPVEVRYLRAALWGYQGFEAGPAVRVMRTHAAKIWIARAMAEVPLAPSKAALPLATLSMLLRGHALARAWE